MRPLLGPACDPNNSPQRNFYFDLFASCSFFGKGVYNVSAFDAVVGNQIPTETILSHDTLEACLLRTGFAGDVAFSEQPPLNLKSYLERQHRWARGDWQNVFLIYGPFKKALAFRRFREISPLIKYLLFVFARRSLLPIARAALLLCILLSDEFLVSKRVVLCISLWLIPDAIDILLAFIAMSVVGQVIYHRRLLLSRVATALRREVLLSVLALHQTLLLGDAVVRTFQRFCRGKKLLSWRAASFSESQSEATGLVEIYAAISVFVSAATSSFLLWRGGSSVWTSSVTLIWCLYGALFLTARVFSGSLRASAKPDAR